VWVTIFEPVSAEPLSSIAGGKSSVNCTRRSGTIHRPDSRLKEQVDFERLLLQLL
jgi:hypothetical protein